MPSGRKEVGIVVGIAALALEVEQMVARLALPYNFNINIELVTPNTRTLALPYNLKFNIQLVTSNARYARLRI